MLGIPKKQCEKKVNKMIPSFMITFREGLEAFLIVGIILAYLAQTKRTELNKHVYAATGLAVLGSIGAHSCSMHSQ